MYNVCPRLWAFFAFCFALIHVIHVCETLWIGLLHLFSVLKEYIYFISYTMIVLTCTRARILRCQYTMALDESPLHLICNRCTSFMIVVSFFLCICFCFLFSSAFFKVVVLCNRSCTFFSSISIFSSHFYFYVYFSFFSSGWPFIIHYWAAETISLYFTISQQSDFWLKKNKNHHICSVVCVCASYRPYKIIITFAY